MKKYLWAVAVMVLGASCSSPKYTYHFDHYRYESKRTVAPSPESPQVIPETLRNEQPFTMDEKTIVASTKDETVYVAEATPSISKEEAIAIVKNMTKAEKRELKKEIKKYVAANKKGDSVKSIEGSKALEHDVRLAAIFGAVGIVLLIIGGSALYIIGAVSILIGLYFFIRWLSRQ